MAFYYDSNPTTESNKKVISYRQNGVNFEFTTDTDVFSRSDVDFGSDLMLTAMIEDLKANNVKVSSFLDLGCGYGVVGIVMKSVFKACAVTSVDKNRRAVSLTKENSKSTNNLNSIWFFTYTTKTCFSSKRHCWNNQII